MCVRVSMSPGSEETREREYDLIASGMLGTTSQ